MRTYNLFRRPVRPRVWIKGRIRSGHFSLCANEGPVLRCARGCRCASFLTDETWEWAQSLDIRELSKFDAEAAEISANTNGF